MPFGKMVHLLNMVSDHCSLKEQARINDTSIYHASIMKHFSHTAHAAHIIFKISERDMLYSTLQ